MNIRQFLVILSVCFLAMSPAFAARMERIATIVNDDVISFSDVSNRMKMIMSSSRLPDREDVRAKLMPQILSSLIDEQLRFQEAHRLELTVSSEEIGRVFGQIAAGNKLSSEEFGEALRKSGIDISTMERQIEAQISWQKVVQKKLRHKVKVSDTDIDDVLERLSNSRGKTEYLLAEIFLPVEDATKEDDVRNLARDFALQIKKKEVPFIRVAQQFSKSAGSMQGGDIGWIREGYLSDELDDAIASLAKNQVSGAVRSLSGYHIFLLRDKRIMSDETLPTREDVEQSLGVERLDRLQQRHFLDLKAAAFIEKRV